VQCSAGKAGPGGCQAPVTWVVKAASMRRYACGRHLNRVCLALLSTGVAYMTVSIEDG